MGGGGLCEKTIQVNITKSTQFIKSLGIVAEFT